MAERHNGGHRPENPKRLHKTNRSTSGSNSLSPDGVPPSVSSSRSQDPLSDHDADRMDTATPVLSMFSYLNIRGLIPQTVPSKIPYITSPYSYWNITCSSKHKITDTCPHICKPMWIILCFAQGDQTYIYSFVDQCANHYTTVPLVKSINILKSYKILNL